MSEMDDTQQKEATAQKTDSKQTRLTWSHLLFGLALLAIAGAAGGSIWREFSDLGLLARSWRLAPEPDRFIQSLRDDYPLFLDLRRRLPVGAHMAIVGVETQRQHRTVVSLRSLLHRQKVASVSVGELQNLHSAVEPEASAFYVLSLGSEAESLISSAVWRWRLLQRYGAPSRDEIYSLWQPAGPSALEPSSQVATE